MDDYTSATVIFATFNLLAFVIAYFYYDLIKTGNDVSELKNKRAVVIYILSQAFFGIALGSIILFAGLPLVGNIISQFSEIYGFDKAITLEESFLINFCVAFGFIFMFIFNSVLQDGWCAIRTGFKNAMSDGTTK